MTAVAGNMGNQYPLKTGKNERLEFFIQFAVGGTGAVGTITADDANVTVTRNGTGDYTITFPTAPSGSIGNAEIFSPANTVKAISHVAFDPTGAGTQWRINTNNAAGAATDPANGDVVYLSAVLNLRG